METLKTDILALMEQNRRMTSGYHYTLPSPELYPFQWFWDSCFHAIILMHCGELEKARQELYSALSRPLPSGLIPHIIYWEDPNQFATWGREKRGDILNEAWAVEGTSSITQPPIVATVAQRIYEAEPDAEFLEAVYPVMKAYYIYLFNDRRFNGDALAYIINPDESGEDNSPRFDAAVGLPPQHTAIEHLDKRIALIEENAACGFAAHTCMSRHFGIADVPFNILFMEGLSAMSVLAEIVGEHAAAIRFRLEHDEVRDSIQSFLKQESMYAAYDYLKKEHVTTKTWGMFMPLYGGLLTDEEAAVLVEQYLMNEEHFKTPYLIPTTARSEPAYDPLDGFWRGPVWMAPNLFIYKGLKHYGYDDIANSIRDASLELITQSGFREQYNPETGEGVGAKDFTWSGLVLDME